MKKVLLFVLFLVLFAGCGVKGTSNTVPYAGKVDLTNIYVARQPKDKRECEQIIAQKLQEKGYNATFGELENMPENTTALVTYVDKWSWGGYVGTMTLVDITLTFRNPKDNFPIVSSHIYNEGERAFKSGMLGSAVDFALKEIKGEK